MTKTKKRNAVDEYVGARVRGRRKELGMNQSVLGKKLGLTFQMIQRYEYGLCRISASTLYAIAIALETPVGFFFEGLAGTDGQTRRNQLGAGAIAGAFQDAPRPRPGNPVPAHRPPRQPARDRRAGAGDGGGRDYVRGPAQEAR